MSKHAFGYIRVSTERQAVHGVSLEAQQAKITAWCQANDVELAEVFVDAGISGKKARNRPGLQNALDAACKAGGVLVVYSLSRLARSTKDTIAITERLDKAEADLVSLSEKIDTTSAAGRMVFRMMAVLAEFESELISERVSNIWSHKRAKGEKTAGYTPFGYDVTEAGTLVENDREQRVIELIDELKAGGLTVRAIAAELNDRGITTKTGRRWSHTQVHRTLKRAA